MGDALGTDALTVYTGCCYVTQMLIQKHEFSTQSITDVTILKATR